MIKKYKVLFSLLLVVTMIFGSISSISAVTSETINGTTGKHQVSGDTATGNFSVTLKDANDTIDVYQIAEMKWDTEKKSYKAVEWIEAVKNWIASSGTYNTATYQTPESLAKASTELQTAFYSALLLDEGNVIGELTAVDAGSVVKTNAVKADPDQGIAAKPAYYTVSNQNFGIFGVLGTNSALSNKKYQPLTISLVPEVEGPVGNWYLSEDIAATLKGSSDIKITKLINDKTVDTVQIGETVDFSVITGFPTYDERDKTNSSVNSYTLSFDDKLSDAFSLDSSTVKLMYRVSSDGDWIELPKTYNGKSLYSALIAGPAATQDGVGVSVYACNTESHINQYKVYLFRYSGDSNYYWYYYRNGAFHPLKTTTTKPSNMDELRVAYQSATGDTVNHSTVYKSDLVTNVFNVTFNYEEIRDYIKATYDTSTSIQEFKTTYQATVNSNAQVGTEYNSNTATLNYEEDTAGDIIGNISSTVNAYTYGVNIIKVDGKDASKYLAGAVFDLYREMDTFCSWKEAESSLYENTDDYVWISNADGKASTFGTLAAVKADASGTKYYYFKQEVDSCAKHDGKHEHIVVYKQYGDSITSTGSAAGITVKGLDPCNYILQEKTAPANYNKLAEDILFTIKELDEETANSTYNGSLAAFVNDMGETVTSGVYSLEVKNYQGITLPSTGGMGTTIFTIIGILLMLFVLIKLIKMNKRKRNSAIDMLLAAILITTLIFTAGKQAYATDTITLEGETGVIVSGDEAKTNFSVTVKNESDTVDIYKIAEMTWNTEKSSYNDLAWVYAVQDWVNNNETFKTYSTPELLGEASTKVQTEFLSALLNDNNIMSNLVASYQVNTDNITKETVEGVTTYTAMNQSFGLYFVNAKNATLGKKYQPVTVDAIPTREGPFGNWYLQSNISTTLKFENIVVDKKINDKKFDLVRNGETTNFQVTAEVPRYPELEPGSSVVYPFNIKDSMADAFKYNDKTLAVQYYDGTEWKTLDESNYTALYGNAAESTSDTTGVATYVNGTEVIYAKAYTEGANSIIDYYSLDKTTGKVTLLYQGTGKLATTSSISNTTLNTNYNNAMGTSITGTFTRQAIGNWEDVFAISFDYNAVKDLGATQVRLTYTADVTANAVVGADVNTNPVDLLYQGDASGAIAKASDSVIAWTYAMKIIKQDGDTNAYLAGAIFNLYRISNTYYAPSSVTDTDEAAYENYLWYNNADGETTAPVGDIEGTPTTLSNLKQVTQVTDAANNNYYRIVKVSAEDAVNCTHENHDGEHYHIVVYSLLKSDITSVSNAGGVTVSGLDPSSYLLKETKAPDGYNRLNEVLYFDINALSTEEANASDGSYKAFIGDDNVKYDDGVYPITVLNYAGIQLPSTGGIGTNIFTQTSQHKKALQPLQYQY